MWLQEHLIFNWKLSEEIHALGFGRIDTEFGVAKADNLSKKKEILTNSSITFFLSALIILGEKLLSKSRNLLC